MTDAQAAHWALTVGRMFSDSPTNGEYARLKKEMVKRARLEGVGKKRVYVFADGTGLSEDLSKVYSAYEVREMLG